MSADNAGLWLLMLVGVLGIPLGAFILRANGRPPVGAFIAAVLAVEFVATKRDAGRNEG